MTLESPPWWRQSPPLSEVPIEGHNRCQQWVLALGNEDGLDVWNLRPPAAAVKASLRDLSSSHSKNLSHSVPITTSWHNANSKPTHTLIRAHTHTHSVSYFAPDPSHSTPHCPHSSFGCALCMTFRHNSPSPKSCILTAFQVNPLSLPHSVKTRFLGALPPHSGGNFICCSFILMSPYFLPYQHFFSPGSLGLTSHPRSPESFRFILSP